ncbi:MAG: class I SAM-dependent methyltransferase [Acidobacteria bacterium]|nr:class I SAM-dependent methyltransferase [Acidobacteriota bacterium]
MQTAVAIRTNKLPKTIAAHTRFVYDHLASVYPASTYFFHSKAHKKTLEMSELRNGMTVLEIATGSGEMFRRLVRANPDGYTCGVDLSPKMAARTQRVARSRFPKSSLNCQAVDCRALPFLDETFDSIFCCYLFELLASDDIVLTLDEIYRVMKPGSNCNFVLIGQQAGMFNRAYDVAGALVPAFWGRQVANAIPDLVHAAGFRIKQDHLVRQGFYPSRILIARKD